jgi:hypothetical protein
VDVDPIAVSGVWRRHIPAGGDVWYEPPQPADGRWQHGSVAAAFYFADDEPTAWAEWYRFLAEAGVPPMAALSRDLWQWEVDVEVADLSTPDQLSRVGLPMPIPGQFQWPSFQSVGDELWRDGWAGLIAPSAARPASKILCLFRESRRAAGVEPLPPPVRHDFPPLVPRGMTT